MLRRDFLKQAGATSLAAAATERTVRIGVVGVGSRGTALLRTLLELPGVEVPAICDVHEETLARALNLVEKTGRKRPQGYFGGPEDFRRLVARDDLDAVLNATPWEWHTPIAVATMRAGKYAAVEVPAAVTVEECWELVETSEKTGKPCMMLENACYFRNVLAVLNMVRQGVFGELLHCECGYQHDVLRYRQGGSDGQLTWRARHALARNGNLYPTHAIGPVAWWMDIHRGDRFTYLTSMSTKSRGLNLAATRQFGADHENAKRRFALGDINTTLIQTAKGLTVTLYFDWQAPRPYDLIFRVQGTRGIYSGTLEKIYIEDPAHPGNHAWEDPAKYYEKYQHPLWKSLGATAMKYGHSGGDYMTLQQFVKAVRNKTQTPIDVYDSAAWSVISPLTERSVASKSAPVDFPDFTRGQWEKTKPAEITEGE